MGEVMMYLYIRMEQRPISRHGEQSKTYCRSEKKYATYIVCCLYIYSVCAYIHTWKKGLEGYTANC